MRTLPSGLRVVWDDYGALGTTAIGYLVGAGSRHETPEQWGAAHFLEHAAFKGAGDWDAKAIAALMDELGGEINAFTTRDYTCFYAKVLAPLADAALDLLTALVSRPWLAPDDIVRERQVILEEMREARDDLADRCEEAYLSALYPLDSIAHDPLGTARHIRRVTASALTRFHQHWYHPANLVLAVSGEGASAIVERLDDRLPFRPGDAAPVPSRPGPPTPAPREVWVREPAEQVHMMVGVAAPPVDDPRYYAAVLLATILGGQNSSRLWQRLREEEGLAYSVSTSYSGYVDWGELSTYLAVQPASLSRALHLTGEELAILKREGPRSEELARAVVQVKTSLVFGLETPEGRMLRLGRAGLADRAPLSLSVLMDRFNRVSPGDIQALAQDLWDSSSNVAIAAVGALPKTPGSFREWMAEQ